MKKALILTAALSLIAFSCKQEKTENHTTTIDNSVQDSLKTGKVMIDSVRVQDSLVLSETLTLDYRNKFLLFSGLEKPLLDSLYSKELPEKNTFPADYSKETVNSLMKKDMQNFFTEMNMDSNEYMPTHKQIWDQVSEMKVHSEQNGFLTVNYSGYGYTGGAHGYAYENYKVADTKNQKIVHLEDIVDVSKVNWNEVLLSRIEGGKDMIFEPEKLTYNQNFYFDQEKITFVYGQYEIAAYAAGIIPVEVPFSAISSALKPEFKERMSIK